MTVSELIRELSKLPKTYEVVVCLAPMEENPDLMNPDDMFQTMSSFLYSTDVDEEEKLAFIFGVAIPNDSPKAVYGDN
jgi:hypothetical protein